MGDPINQLSNKNDNDSPEVSSARYGYLEYEVLDLSTRPRLAHLNMAKQMLSPHTNL